MVYFISNPWCKILSYCCFLKYISTIVKLYSTNSYVVFVNLFVWMDVKSHIKLNFVGSLVHFNASAENNQIIGFKFYNLFL